MIHRILTTDLEPKKSTLKLRKPQKMDKNVTFAARPSSCRIRVGTRNFFHAGNFLSKIRGLRNLGRLRFFLIRPCEKFGGELLTHGELS